MLKIISVLKDSDAYKKGLRVGDIIEKINGYDAIDQLDFYFYQDDEVSLKVSNKGELKVKDASSTIETEEFSIKRCSNNCIFCFVSQMPKGQRKTLYLKDDDYRMSFLFGSYITLTNLKDADYERIIRLKLSPLYISVHTVDKELRKKIMRYKDDSFDIKEKIEFLVKNGIQLHTQLVLMPGINDREKLEESIMFLGNLYPMVQTVSVVPIGLTKFRDNLTPLRRYKLHEAKEVISIVRKYQNKLLNKFDEPFVYATDEFYLVADEPFPEFGHDELLDNGVGLYFSFKEEFKRYEKRLEKYKNDKIAVITSIDGAKILKEFFDKMRSYGIDIETMPVKNSFFGETVTVTGLLTAGDIKKKILEIKEKYDRIIVPNVVLNEDNFFLDGKKREFIETLSGNVIFVETNAKGLINGVIGR